MGLYLSEQLLNRNDITIRLEKEEDYSNVEFMIRESFWNVYRPGALEHFVIHVLRDDPAFVKDLDFVMEKEGQLIGQNTGKNSGVSGSGPGTTSG